MRVSWASPPACAPWSWSKVTKSTLVSMGSVIGVKLFTGRGRCITTADAASAVPAAATAARCDIWMCVSLRRRCACTRAMSSCRSKGLWIQSLQPSSRPLTTELAWFLAETMMMGSCSGETVLRCSVRTSKPLMPGIIKSNRMRSGMTVLSFSMYSRHSEPLMQMTIVKPNGSSTERMTSWFTWSSSTDMITLGPDGVTGGGNGGRTADVLAP
mmetsp:Transcript_2703/g.9095  ORF Transcript_2703/g.9095 Transcript_2703/m.9095 type:complete len:213 (+) Transcript_2703:155-793(+)